MTYAAELLAGQPAQAVGPDHTEQLGAPGADLTVPSLAVANSGVSTRNGLVLISIPGGSNARIRIGDNVVATANDQLYPGGDVYHMAIRIGENVSIFGDASGFVATVSLAR